MMSSYILIKNALVDGNTKDIGFIFAPALVFHGIFVATLGSSFCYYGINVR